MKRPNFPSVLAIFITNLLCLCSVMSSSLSRSYIGAIDQGTSSTRFMIFNEKGEVVSVDQVEHTQIYPEPGWVEHNPKEIWANTEKVIQKALKKKKIKLSQLAAVGITNQRETTVVWNKLTGEPYYNAIVWNDVRTSAICDQLEKGGKGGIDRFREKTGLPIAPYFSGTKLKWILENCPEAKEAAERGEACFGTIDSWLIWNLSKGKHHITDVTNACRTLLMDIDTLQWDDDQIEAFSIPKSMLPEIRSSCEVYCEGEGVLAGVPIAGILGDQQAALFGQACTRPGMAKSTYGTGAFILMNTGTEKVPSKSGLLTTVGYKLGEEAPVYALEGSVAYCGSLIQWLRDNLQMFKDASETESIAQTVEDNGGMYLVPAFSGLFAPYWRKDARGVVAGLTAFNTKAHFVRAALEAAAFQVWKVLQAMEIDSGVKVNLLKVDGGMTANELVMQFQSDLIRVGVVRPMVPETTCLGAAYAAGLAVGFFNSLDQINENWQLSKSWDPLMPQEKAQQYIEGWEKAVERTLGWEGLPPSS